MSFQCIKYPLTVAFYNCVTSHVMQCGAWTCCILLCHQKVQNAAPICVLSKLPPDRFEVMPSGPNPDITVREVCYHEWLGRRHQDPGVACF